MNEYIAQLKIFNKKKIFFRPTDPVKKLFIETGNKQLFFFRPKRGLMTTGGQIPIEKHYHSFHKIGSVCPSV